MFDWPEQIQTSPTSTSSTASLFLPVTASVCGPPTGSGSSVTQPLALVVGLGRLPLAGDRDGHLLARIGPAPDAVLLALLQDHVVGEQRRQADVGQGRRRQRQQRHEARGGRETDRHERKSPVWFDQLSVATVRYGFALVNRRQRPGPLSYYRSDSPPQPVGASYVHFISHSPLVLGNHCIDLRGRAGPRRRRANSERRGPQGTPRVLSPHRPAGRLVSAGRRSGLPAACRTARISDLAAVTYACTIHKTFGWELPHEEKTIEFLLARQKPERRILQCRGHGRSGVAAGAHLQHDAGAGGAPLAGRQAAVRSAAGV